MQRSGIGRNAGKTIRAYTENGVEYQWESGFALKKIPASLQ
jgi:hypothetical protein